MRRLLSVSLLLSLAQMSCIFKSSSSAVREDSQVSGASAEVVYSRIVKLAQSMPQVVSLHEFARIPGFPVPLVLVKVSLPGAGPGERSAIFISDVTHGNEYIGIVDRLLGFASTVAGRMAGVVRSGDQPLELDTRGYEAFLKNGGVYYFIPMLNPTGYSVDKRENGEEIDLNRDFPLDRDSQSAEVKALRRALDERLGVDGTTLRLTVDYHCCSRENRTTLLLRPSDQLRPEAPLSEKGMANFGAFVGLARSTLGEVAAGSTQEMLGYFGPNTSKDYYYYKYMKPQEAIRPAMAVTLEGIRKETEERNPNLIREHFSLWNRASEWISEK